MKGNLSTGTDTCVRRRTVLRVLSTLVTRHVSRSKVFDGTVVRDVSGDAGWFRYVVRIIEWQVRSKGLPIGDHIVHEAMGLDLSREKECGSGSDEEASLHSDGIWMESGWCKD